MLTFESINFSTHSPHRPGALLTILTYSVLVVPHRARVKRHADLGGVGLREARTDGRKGGAVTRRLSCPDVSKPERNNKATWCCEGEAAIAPGRAHGGYGVA